jgi:hypothetical protein
VADDDRGRGTGDTGKIMMFGQPIAMVAPLFRMLGEIDRVFESERSIAAFNDRGKIENGRKDHSLM